MALHLTKRICETAAATGKGWSTLWDADVRGLGLRVRRSGRRVFVLFYRNQRCEKRLLTLGGFPELPLDEARRLAKKTLAEVVIGGDPLAERKRIRRASSMAELAELYLEGHAKLHKRSWQGDGQRIRKHVVPAWGTRKAETITRTDVALLHRRLGAENGTTTANRLLALVSHLFHWAEGEGLVPENHPNPARRVPRFREHARERWLTPAEVRRILRALEAERNVSVRGFFWLLLMTGCRKRELLHARWSALDLESGLLRLNATKNGRTHYVPLAAPALRILAQLPRVEGNPHVFIGRGQGEPLSVAAIDQAWRRIRTAADVPDAWLHDLRRTVGSWLAQSGVSLHLIGHVLNHSSPIVTSVYARLANESTRAVLERHAEAVVRVVAGDDVANTDAVAGVTACSEDPTDRGSSESSQVQPSTWEP